MFAIKRVLQHRLVKHHASLIYFIDLTAAIKLRSAEQPSEPPRESHSAKAGSCRQPDQATDHPPGVGSSMVPAGVWQL